MRVVQRWQLYDVATPGGTRSPVVLHSVDGESRLVLVTLEPGQEMGDHQVKEGAFVLVVGGEARVEAGGDAVLGGAGDLFRFDPDERRAISSEGGARLLLMLAPWPGGGHYRGERAEDATAPTSS